MKESNFSSRLSMFRQIKYDTGRIGRANGGYTTGT